MDQTSSYGVIDPGARDDALIKMKGLVEKSSFGTAPSNSILPSHYILQPEIMKILATQEVCTSSEIRLTDDMALLIG